MKAFAFLFQSPYTPKCPYLPLYIVAPRRPPTVPSPPLPRGAIPINPDMPKPQALNPLNSLNPKPSKHHPSLILAWWGGVRASANIFKAIFGTSMGYMLRGSKKWLGRRQRSAKPFFVETFRIHVEGVGKSLQRTAALLLGFLRPRLVWCK